MAVIVRCPQIHLLLDYFFILKVYIKSQDMDQLCKHALLYFMAN